MTPDFAPRQLRLVRRPEPELTVEVGGVTAVARSGRSKRKIAVRGNAFAISGPAPVSLVGALLRFVQRRALHDPFALLPAGTARVELRGRESVAAGALTATLDRWLVTGLGTGNAFVFSDPALGLVAFVGHLGPWSRFAAVREGYEAALPTFEQTALRESLEAGVRAVLAVSVESRGPTAIIGGRLIDGTGARAIADSVVVFQEGKIVAAGRRGKVKIENGTRFMYAKGRTILPGLWDFDARISGFEDAARLLSSGVSNAYAAGEDLALLRALKDGAASQALAPVPALRLALDVEGPDGEERRARLAQCGGGKCDAVLLGASLGEEERAASAADARSAGLPAFALLTSGAAPPEGVLALVLAPGPAANAPPAGVVKAARRAETPPLVAGSADADIARAAELLVASGATPVQAIRVLTSVSARAAGQAPPAGTIAAGQRADLVIVEGDASRSIRALRKVAVIVVRGRALNPSLLRERLGLK